MDKDELARLHSAGAIIRHKSPFDYLASHKNSDELSKEFIDKWCAPFYMTIAKTGPEWIESVKTISPEITKDVTLNLLGDFNWRTRLVGAYLSAVKNYTDQIDIIGTHLLKSETCCVGHVYALVLTFYNNDKSRNYLLSYLDYYLKRPDLFFDQNYVLAAVSYLDTNNKSSIVNTYKEYIEKIDQRYVDYFSEQINILDNLNKYSS